MKDYVSIGWPEKRGQWDKPEAEREYTAGQVDTLEEAHAIIAMSKSPVWTIRHSEQDDFFSHRQNEIECSPMVKLTRELEQAERVKEQANTQARVDRINAQPKVVTKTYAGIAVTFTRDDCTNKSYRHEASVSTSAEGEQFYPSSYITEANAIQKQKWVKDCMRWAGHPKQRLIPLAPHLKDIQAVADSLSKGRYVPEPQETTP